MAEYRRRVGIETTFADCESNGCNLEASELVDLARLERLLLAVFLALCWSELLGLQATRSGLRRRFDRAGRCKLAVAWLCRR